MKPIQIQKTIGGLASQREEIATFRKRQLIMVSERIARETKLKAGLKRNDRCYCESGKKYKVCCWNRR